MFSKVNGAILAATSILLVGCGTTDAQKAEIAALEKKMYEHAHQLEFEQAGAMRDLIQALQKDSLGF